MAATRAEKWADWMVPHSVDSRVDSKVQQKAEQRDCQWADTMDGN